MQARVSVSLPQMMVARIYSFIIRKFKVAVDMQVLMMVRK